MYCYPLPKAISSQTVMDQWLGILPENRGLLLPAARLIAVRCQTPLRSNNQGHIKLFNDNSAKSNYNSSGRRTAKEPPLQKSLPKGGHLHPLGDVAPGPPQRAGHHGGQSLIATRGLHRSGGAQSTGSLPVGLRGGLDNDLVFLEKTPRGRRRAPIP